MKQFKVNFSYEALEDIRSIHFYIAYVLIDELNANKLVSRISNAIKKLNILPSRNPLIDCAKLNDMFIRKLVIDGYLVLYRIDEKQCTVNILRVISSKIDLNQITVKEIS